VRGEVLSPENEGRTPDERVLILFVLEYVFATSAIIAESAT
jgi:hypothetical protein